MVIGTIELALENSRKVLGADVPYWFDLLEHTTYDEFWRSRAITPHLERVPPAVLTVGDGSTPRTWRDAPSIDRSKRRTRWTTTW